jgi:3',5'-cyclic AMP phosphodiesterase CpdA
MSISPRFGKAVFPLILVLILVQSACLNQPQPASQPKSVVIYGDSRTGHYTHQRVVSAIVQSDPDVVFHTGDLVEDGLVAEQWDTFNDIVSPLLETAEFYPALGNHERNSHLFFDNFVLPNNERWYSVQWDDIHFILLDSNSDISKGSEQYAWLESELKRISNTGKFIVVILHHPPFSTGPHTEDGIKLRDSIVPLFEKYGVDIVFSGHDHAYERSLHNGVYYIVTGGGGAPLYSQTRTSPYSLVFVKAHHFCRLYVADNKLTVNVLDINLKTIDKFTVAH